LDGVRKSHSNNLHRQYSLLLTSGKSQAITYVDSLFADGTCSSVGYAKRLADRRALQAVERLRMGFECIGLALLKPPSGIIGQNRSQADKNTEERMASS